MLPDVLERLLLVPIVGISPDTGKSQSAHGPCMKGILLLTHSQPNRQIKVSTKSNLGGIA